MKIAPDERLCQAEGFIAVTVYRHIMKHLPGYVKIPSQHTAV